MHQPPDYGTLRRETPFEWSVAGSYLSCLKLAEVPIRDFFLQPEACIEAYRTGRRRLGELFGPDVGVLAPSTPPISYGHPASLGAELYFPEGGEVAVEHLFQDSLDRAMAALRRAAAFGEAPRARFYLDFLARMQKAFPEEKVVFAYGWEGPVTSAYELRGDAFFLDLFDEPEKTREFLGLLTASIVDFHAWHGGVAGEPAVRPDGIGLCDDISSMVPPRLWDRFVLPFWEQFFTGTTSGKRTAHVEDLRPAQLPCLEAVGLWYYDPSISRHLNPPIIARACRVPFGWRLGSFHYRDMTCGDVEDFVYQAAADGASKVFTILEGNMCEAPALEKVKAFIRAGKAVKRLLDRGVARAELRGRAAGRGGPGFWETWPPRGRSTVQ